MFKRIKTLRSKLMIVVSVLLLIPMLIVVLIAHHQSQTVIREKSLRLNTSLVNAGADKVDTMLQSLDDLYRSLYLSDHFRAYLRMEMKNEGNLSVSAYRDMLSSDFLTNLSTRPDVYSMIYIDTTGQVTYATRNEAGSYANYRTCHLADEYVDLIENASDWKEGTRLLPTKRHMPLQKIKGESPYVFAVARRILNVESHFEPLGILFITIDLSELAHTADMIRPDASALVLIYRNDGMTLFHSGVPDGVSPIPTCLLENAALSSGDTVIWNGIPYRIALSSPETREWSIATLIPENVYSADAMRVARAILFATLSALLVIAAITAVASKAISRPVETLARTMDATNLNALLQGGYQIEVTGNDEIARLGTSFNQLMGKLNESIKNEYEMKIQEKNANLRALQAQMNPHFLYNVLQSISSMATLHHAPEIVSMTGALGSVLRYTIGGANALVPMREELEHMLNYLYIQKIRFGDRLLYTIDIPEFMKDFQLPRVSLQPMVENAILHGFEGREEAGHLLVHAWVEETRWIIEVADDGAGMIPERLKALQETLRAKNLWEQNKASGMALANLQARLSLLYTGTAALEIESEHGVGTCVRMVMPLSSKGEPLCSTH